MDREIRRATVLVPALVIGLGLGSLALSAGGCSDGASSPANVATCPGEAALESLHAAAFYLEHGPLGSARAALADAHARLPGASQAEVAALLARLDAAAARAEADPTFAKTETEWIRFFFSDWTCLPAALHEGFHRKLPPIP